MSDTFLTLQPGAGEIRGQRGRPFCVIRHQSASVPIYASQTHGKTRYTIAFFMDGRRQRRMFTSLDEAKHEAKLAAEKIQRGLQTSNDLRPAERESYLAAQRRLKEFDIPLLAAVEEYVKCRERLGNVPLLAAVEEFLRATRGVTLGVSVAQVCDELITCRMEDGVSDRYRLQLSSTLNLFKAAFPGPIMGVKSEQIDRWLRDSKLSPVTRNNRLTIIRVLFNFAKQRNYLPKSEETEAEGVAKVKAGSAEAEIFEPAEMRKLLLAAPVRLIPLLAIGAFTGLRAAELSRLDWKAVNMERRMIELRAGQAKTASRRIIPISDNLAVWLERVERNGRLIPDMDLFRQATALARKLGIRWPRNVLRHSFISYRVAQIQDVNRVALEAGNSPKIIFRHYRELVTEEAAAEWFAIAPPEGWTPPTVPWDRRNRVLNDAATSVDTDSQA